MHIINLQIDGYPGAHLHRNTCLGSCCRWSMVLHQHFSVSSENRHYRHTSSITIKKSSCHVYMYPIFFYHLIKFSFTTSWAVFQHAADLSRCHSPWAATPSSTSRIKRCGGASNEVIGKELTTEENRSLLKLGSCLPRRGEANGMEKLPRSLLPSGNSPQILGIFLSFSRHYGRQGGLRAMLVFSYFKVIYIYIKKVVQFSTS